MTASDIAAAPTSGVVAGGRCSQARIVVATLGLAAFGLASACGTPPPVAQDVPDVRGTLTVDGAPAQLTRCRPGHAVHVFVEVDSSRGTLRFGDGKLSWNGAELSCAKLDRSWGGGVRRDDSAYFRGTLAFRCGTLAGELSLDCGQITADEGAELTRNRAAAIGARERPEAPPAGSGSSRAASSR